MTARRVGLLSYNFLPSEGGQGRHFFELSRRLRNREGIETLALSPHRLSDPDHRPLLTTVRRLPPALAQLGFSLALRRRLEQLVRRERLDLVIVNGGPGGVLLGRLPGVPTVCYVSHTYQRQYREVPGQRWKRLLVPIERRGYRRADRVVCCSTATRGDLAEGYGLDSDEVAVIPVGVDTEVFRPLEVERVPRSMLYLGRLDARKGVHFLLEAMPLVLERLPDATLFIAGSGPDRRKLEGLVDSNQLTDRIVFLGRLDEESLPGWYNRCVVQVVPSVFEGLGIVALEGLACGVLLVATTGSGLDDIVDDGSNGLLVDHGDRRSLAKALVSLLDDSAKHDEIRSRGVRSVRQQFGWEGILDRWVTLIDETIDDRA